MYLHVYHPYLYNDAKNAALSNTNPRTSNLNP